MNLPSPYRLYEMNISRTVVKDKAPVIHSYYDCVREIVDYLGEKGWSPLQEHFLGLYLSTRLKLVDIEIINIGLVDECSIDVPATLRPAILLGAPNIILAHNHPSGELKPSEDDVRMTDLLKRAAEVFKIRILDSIIFNDFGDSVSMAELGHL